MKHKHLWSLLLAVLLLVSLLTGCSGADKLTTEPHRGAANGSSEEWYGTYDDPYYSADKEDASEDVGISTNLTGAVDPSRKIIERVEMTVQTKTYDALMSALSAKLKAVGGYVESARESSSGQRSSYIVVRVPAEKTADFQSALKENGTVTDSYTTTEDVTLAYVDIESRIAALEAEQTALLAMLEQAKDVKDLLDIQSRVTEVTAQLESYESRLRTYDSLVSYSTITLNVYEVERVEVVEELTVWQEIGQTLSHNLEDIGDGFVDFFVWFVSTLPYLLLIAIPVGVVLFVLIRRHRRKAQSQPKAE